MNHIVMVFPHQLFENHPAFNMDVQHYILVEDFLFFRLYPFHKSKLVYHRATMKMFEKRLKNLGKTVQYIDALDAGDTLLQLFINLKNQGFKTFITLDLHDNWLEKNWKNALGNIAGKDIILDNPMLLNTREDKAHYLKGKNVWHQTSFYIYQRKTRNILLDHQGKPAGGKWTFDIENRKKYPKNKIPPTLIPPPESEFLKEAVCYVKTEFPENPGQIPKPFPYPVTFDDAKNHLQQFLDTRLSEFGTYEDAIVGEESFLHHSIITPMLNTGLLTPDYILTVTLDYFKKFPDLPLNSVEGFIRQIIGWREFMALVYAEKGIQQRTTNFWNHRRKIPRCFYEGTTGITPIDQTIKKVLATGYCHHIERLMILGNFMLLCEFDPDEVYRWFMEMFIDAYDWVMVPNVYGMSQFADRGLFATKPYISGSNYVLKMSNYAPGPWTKIWDALFWNFLDTNRDYFRKNPRLSMLLRTFDQMDATRKKEIKETSEKFLSSF